MPISYTESISEIPMNGQAFNVTQGTPAGGTYSGPGIIGTSFHPGLAGEGTHAIVYSVQNSNGCFSTDTSYITVLSSNGIPEEDQFLTILPNPAQSTVTIISSSNLISSQLVSSEGKLIKEYQFSNNHTLNIESLRPGVYYLYVKSEAGISKLKFLKIN